MTAIELTSLRKRLHRVPEPGYEEFETQRILLEVLGQLPQERLEVTTWRTGILVLVRGQTGARTLGFRVDMDGLPMEEETGCDFQSDRPGYMHACGHDVHMTIGIGVVQHFVLHPIDDHILMVFQPAEEGPGGALPMMRSREFRAWRPAAIFGLHVAPEYPVGTIATRPGILFANTSELYIDLHGTSGHAAFPHRANDMVVAASHLVGQLQTIVSRSLDPLDSGVVTIGKIVGGTRQNIIAGHARLEGTLRSLSQDSMQAMKRRLEAIVAGIETGFECKADIDYGSNYRQVDNHPDLTRSFMTWVKQTGLANLVECREAMTGEDFGYFLGELPGFMFWLGVDTPYGLHHARMLPSEDAISVAVEVVTRFLTDFGRGAI